MEEHHYILIIGLMVSLIVWAFVLPNRKQLFVRMQGMVILGFLQHFKTIRSSYHAIAHSDKSLDKILKELDSFKTSVSTTIKNTQEIANLTLKKDDPANKSMSKMIQKSITRLEKLLELADKYENFILEREFDYEMGKE